MLGQSAAGDAWGPVADLAEQAEGVAVIPRLRDLAAGDAVDMDAADGDRLPGRVDAGVGRLQGAGEDVADGDEVALGDDLIERVVPIREGSAVLPQTLLVQLAVLLGDEGALMGVGWRQQLAEGLGVTGVEGSEVRPGNGP